jgi:hypothetical protein
VSDDHVDFDPEPLDWDPVFEIVEDIVDEEHDSGELITPEEMARRVLLVIEDDYPELYAEAVLRVRDILDWMTGAEIAAFQAMANWKK